MSCDLILYSGNSSVVELRGVKNTATGLVDTAATVSVSLYDPAGVLVSGQSWPLAMSHVSVGTYRATLPALTLIPGRKYRVVIHAVGSGSGEIGHWDREVTAQVRAA